MRGVRRLFRLNRTTPAIETDVGAEIETHLAMRTDELVARGMSAEAARAEARRQFGDIDGTRAALTALDASHHTHAQSAELWRGFGQDIRLAWRRLGSSPAFTAVAVLTLALGIGAVAAIGSVVQQVLLRPLPFPQQDRLVREWPIDPAHGATRALSVPDLEDWRQGQRDVTALGGYWYRAGQTGADLTGIGEPERVPAAEVTPGFFETLGVTPELGRVPRTDEQQEGGVRVVVLSDALWRRRFNADPAIVGRAIVLDGVPHVVVGVMPPSMRFPDDGPEMWRSALYEPQTATPWKDRANGWMQVIARLAPGVTVQRAQADLSTLQRHLAEAYPDADFGWTAARVEPLLDAIVGDVRPALLVMLGAVGCVLLIATVNIAALLLARSTARAQEFAVRTALGAPARRLVRQLLTESTLLALVGGVVGMFVAALILPLLVRLASGELPRLPAAHLGWTVPLVTLAASLVAGPALGLLPAFRLASTHPGDAIGEGGSRGSTAGAGRLRARQALVVAEVTIAVVLVCGAGLMVKSFVRLMRTDTGFRPDHALAVTFQMSAESFQHNDTAMARYYSRVIEEVGRVPGVTAVGAAKVLPFQGEDEPWGVGIVGEPIPPLAQRPTAIANHVSAGYFRAIGTPVLAGREFTRADTLGAPDAVIVNEAFARRFVPGPISDLPGRLVVLGDSSRVRIVGVVRNVHENGLDAEPQPAMYLATPQNMRSGVTLVVRTQDDPTAMTGAVERAIWSVDKDQTITRVTTLDDIMHRAVARPRLLSVLLAAFGTLGLLLGALGISGVVAYAVGQRRREIGVRVALGATRHHVLETVVGDGVKLTLLGVVIGLAAAFLATRAMRSVLFGIGPADPITYAEVAALLALVAVLAAYLPARRALAIDPVEALKGTA